MDGQGNINVNAPNDITFSAGKNLNINVAENMTTSVGQNQSNNVGNNLNTSVGNDIIETAMGNRLEMSDNRTEIIDKNYDRQSDSVDIVANKIIASSQDDIIMQSVKTVYMNSGEKSNLF